MKGNTRGVNAAAVMAFRFDHLPRAATAPAGAQARSLGRYLDVVLML